MVLKWTIMAYNVVYCDYFCDNISSEKLWQSQWSLPGNRVEHYIEVVWAKKCEQIKVISLFHLVILRQSVTLPFLKVRSLGQI